MTLLSLTDCCHLLDIDAKTLRHWLTHAHMPHLPHPTDGRIKALSQEQVQHLADLQAGHLAVPEQSPTCQQEPASPPPVLAPVCHAAPALLDKLSQLQAQVTSLQHQVTHLALSLLHEPEPPLHARVMPTASCASPSTEESSREPAASQQQALSASSRRTRSRVLPLIEYGARGSYVVISPTHGQLSLLPDSPEWFAWLAGLSSFRFVGKCGRFSAHRVFQKAPTCYWQAQRSIHQHRYKPYLGRTERLTIDLLEQTAATLQSLVDRL